MDLRQIIAVSRDVFPVLNQLVANRLLGIGRVIAELRHAIDHIAGQMKPIHVVAHRHVKGRRRSAFFFIAAHVEIIMIAAPVRQPVNQPGITVIGKYNRLIGGKKRIEIF